MDAIVLRLEQLLDAGVVDALADAVLDAGGTMVFDPKKPSKWSSLELTVDEAGIITLRAYPSPPND